jgi:hypothetical protein
MERGLQQAIVMPFDVRHVKLGRWVLIFSCLPYFRGFLATPRPSRSRTFNALEEVQIL